MFRQMPILATLLIAWWSSPVAVQADDVTVERARTAMKQAARYYYEQVATHGGYVYHYSLDLQTRWGEGLATEDQIWIQPPGTPTVGMAFLDAYRATGDEYYLNAARDAAHAVAYGQLKSGGWQNCVDFNPRGARVNQYRNGKGGGKNNSSFDDGQSQSALLFLIRTDAALEFQDAKIHEAATVGLQAVLDAQFPNGAFPQVFTGPVQGRPTTASRANFPDYDWRTEGRIKNYWDMYTLNDNVLGYLTQTLLAAHQVYGDEQSLEAVRQIGDFLLIAQLPQPQPGWAQQYNDDLQPIWARKFEPPAVSGDETQEAIDTLLDIVEYTRDPKYLQPIPAALAWLQKVELPDGQLARYYELRTNRPLYMERRGDVYSLTYDDSNLPSHYGWKTTSRIEELQQRVKRVKDGKPDPPRTDQQLESAVREIISALDAQGRWITVSQGERLVGQPKIRPGDAYLSSERFSNHLSTLSEFLTRRKSVLEQR